MRYFGMTIGEALRRLGAEVVEGDLTDLASMHRAIEGCGRIYLRSALTVWIAR
jgi:uncharacterized protein YbjT (DUF2867 family)